MGRIVSSISVVRNAASVWSYVATQPGLVVRRRRVVVAGDEAVLFGTGVEHLVLVVKRGMAVCLPPARRLPLFVADVVADEGAGAGGRLEDNGGLRGRGQALLVVCVSVGSAAPGCLSGKLVAVDWILYVTGMGWG